MRANKAREEQEELGEYHVKLQRSQKAFRTKSPGLFQRCPPFTMIHYSIETQGLGSYDTGLTPTTLSEMLHPPGKLHLWSGQPQRFSLCTPVRCGGGQLIAMGKSKFEDSHEREVSATVAAVEAIAGRELPTEANGANQQDTSRFIEGAEQSSSRDSRGGGDDKELPLCCGAFPVPLSGSLDQARNVPITSVPLYSCRHYSS
jgi:hypothetical protein